MSHVPTITRWFDLLPAHSTPPAPPNPLPLPAANEILLLTGPSGSGKSTLVRHYAATLPDTLDLQTLHLPNEPIVDCFPSIALADTLLLLSRVGLAEAALYVKAPKALSDGQRFRFRLALALHHATQRICRTNPTTLICDEFCSLLDPETAAVVAHTIRKSITRTPDLRAILATSRPDLLKPLHPDHVIRCDFGRYYPSHKQREATNEHE